MQTLTMQLRYTQGYEIAIFICFRIDPLTRQTIEVGTRTFESIPRQQVKNIVGSYVASNSSICIANAQEYYVRIQKGIQENR